MNAPVLEASDIVKYFSDPVRKVVLQHVSMEVHKGEFVSIVSKSGCGKSTLLYLLSTMDTDYEGTIYLDGELLTGKSEKHLAHVRNKKIGFVFQFHYLISEFTVLQNVTLPAFKLNESPVKIIKEKGMFHLEQLKIAHLASKMANELSGSEKQRVAIARALINDPILLMGDEPTGNLDRKNTEIVFEIFQNLSASYGQSLLVVTHDPTFAQNTMRTIVMDDGKIIP